MEKIDMKTYSMKNQVSLLLYAREKYNTNISTNFKFFEFFKNFQDFWDFFIVPCHLSSEMWFKDFPRPLRENYKGLFIQLEKFRKKIDRPIIITSGFRNKEDNHACGGSLHSFHMGGLASDITFEGINSSWAVELVKLFNGVIWYPDNLFFHVDVGWRVFHKY